MPKGVTIPIQASLLVPIVVLENIVLTRGVPLRLCVLIVAQELIILMQLRLLVKIARLANFHHRQELLFVTPAPMVSTIPTPLNPPVLLVESVTIIIILEVALWLIAALVMLGLITLMRAQKPVPHAPLGLITPIQAVQRLLHVPHAQQDLIILIPARPRVPTVMRVNTILTQEAHIPQFA